ncbi:Mobile element protein [Mycobacterium tuberculosis]|nr:Mobile element protein [Mycobacterium tuberculosis]
MSVASVHRHARTPRHALAGLPSGRRRYGRQAQVDAGARPGTTTEESAELKRLRRDNAELRRANAILKTASAFFAAELDRPAR